MATGVEVASLVLATFPLVIKGLESYAKAVEKFEAWRSYRRELNTYVRKLETCRVTYLNTTELLLDGIVESAEDLEMMLSNPASSLWQKPMYKDQLRSRLHRSFGSYLENSEHMLDRLENMKDKLGLESPGKVCCPRILS